MRDLITRLANRYPLINNLLTDQLPLVLAVAASIILATNLTMFAHSVATAHDNITVYGPVVGGDFAVFDTAASMVADGRAISTYDSDLFPKELEARFPEHGAFRLYWQYPPSMFLMIAPLSRFDFLQSFAVWTLAGLGVFLWAMRNIWNDRTALFLAIATPAAFQSMITGQTGFFSAAALATAALYADRRPLYAGLAAGLLTVKPQLGLLIPIAFAVTGCWRAFLIAALTAGALAITSWTLFGADSWTAFVEAATAQGGRMDSETFPYHKLASAFGGAKMLGASTGLALGVQLLSTVSLAVIVAWVWRRHQETDVRLAVLCAAALLAMPYAFYYEAALLIPAMLAVAHQGMTSGWLRGERVALALLWLAPMGMPGPTAIPGVPYTFLCALAVLLMALRRGLAIGLSSPRIGTPLAAEATG